MFPEVTLLLSLRMEAGGMVQKVKALGEGLSLTPGTTLWHQRTASFRLSSALHVRVPLHK